MKRRCFSSIPLSPMILLSAAALFRSANGFVHGIPRASFHRPTSTRATSQFKSAVSAEPESSATSHADHVEDSTAVRAPLKYMGPYPCLALRFPDLATHSQKQRNVTGVSLDFVLDTAANTNTINAQVAKELDLKVVGEALPGLGAGGAISGGNTYMLGDCRLEGLPKEDTFTFMTGLTAASLPVASPASAGLLSMSFFNCFDGGVEFNWGDNALKDGRLSNPPSVTFHTELPEAAQQNMTRIPIAPIPVTMLPSVKIEINGVAMPALLDTGSPITVLNAQAAKVARVETIQQVTQQQSAPSTTNPFAAMANKFNAAQASAQAAARGDVLAIMDGKGERVELVKTSEPVTVALTSDDQDENKVDFGSGHIYVGDLPGLAAMNGLGVDSPPAVVLGMDILRTRPKMLLRAKANEVYF